MRLNILWLVIALTPFAQVHANDFPTTYEVTYSAKYNGMDVKAKRLLEKTSQGYRIISTVKGMLGGMSEQEDFHIDSHGCIHTDHYLAEKAFFGIKSQEELIVDHAKGEAVYTRKKKRKVLTLKDAYLGPVTYQLQLRKDLKIAMAQEAQSATAEQLLSNNVKSNDAKSHDVKPYNLMSYKVMSRGRVKDYAFEILGNEILSTPMGDIAAIKVQRLREDDERQTVFWMAPAWDFLMIKIRQQEKGGESYEMIIESASIDGLDLNIK